MRVYTRIDRKGERKRGKEIEDELEQKAFLIGNGCFTANDKGTVPVESALMLLDALVQPLSNRLIVLKLIFYEMFYCISYFRTLRHLICSQKVRLGC